MPLSICQTVTANEIVVVMELGFSNSDPKALSILIYSKVQSQQDHIQNLPFSRQRLTNLVFFPDSGPVAAVLTTHFIGLCPFSYQELLQKTLRIAFFPPTLTMTLYIIYS